MEVVDDKKVLHPSISLSADSAPMAKLFIGTIPCKQLNENVRQQKLSELNVAIYSNWWRTLKPRKNGLSLILKPKETII